MITCHVCGKGPADGVNLFRQNRKGVEGEWACKDHSTVEIDPEIEKLAKVVSGVFKDDGSHE
jgi:hypothetical protein